MADKLFTILCETCGCRLQVRDVGVIGQILNCPKCQSMVLVAPPPGWAPSSTPAEATAPVAAVAKPTAKDTRWSEATLSPGSEANSTAAATISSAATELPKPEIPPMPVAETLPSGRSAWVSPTEKLARQWIGLGIGICVGVLLGAGVLWLALGDDEPPSVAETPTAADSAAASPSPDRVEKAPEAPVKQPPVKAADEKKPIAAPPEKKEPLPAAQAKHEPSPKPPPQLPREPQPPPPAEAVPDKPPIAETPVDEPVVAEESPATVSRPPLPAVEIQAQMAVSVPRLEIAKAPLDRTLDLLSSISTIPITIDATVIEFAHIAADTPVSVRLTNPTVKRALDQAVSAAKLSYLVGPDHILVTPTAELMDEWIVVRVALGDLAGGEPKRRAEIAGLVTAIVAPQSWKTSRPMAGEAEIQVDGDDLVVRQTRRAHKELAQFLERMRTARRAGQGGGDLALLRTRRQQIEAPLAHKITLNYAVAAPLSKILNALREETKLCILVDWRALRSLQIDPQTPARMTAANESVETALGSLLTPLDLTYRILDGRTIQITTPAAAAEAMHVEFYAIGDLANNSTAVDKLVGDFRRDWGKLPGQPAGIFNFDAASRCLLLRHTQAGHNEFERRLVAAR